MEKLKLHSPDLTQANIDKLAALFPNCVTETRAADGSLQTAIDFDQLRQELSGAVVEGAAELYQLNWPGKREALLTANAPIAKTLRPCRAESVAFDATQNLFIEGDNLDALKLLQETYLGKVKMIYIDPPYNTGNDFIYADDFSESTASYLQRSNQKNEAGQRMVANTESNGRFHSDWLSMMYPRLKLARNLLRDDGVIFISIDDHEQANLKRLCDEIFGESNFMACVCWQKKYAPANDTVDFSPMHDFVLVYSKERKYTDGGKAVALLNRQERTEEQNRLYKNPDNDERGLWRTDNYLCNKTAEQRPNLYYPITHPKTGQEIWPNRTSVWRYSKERHEQNMQDGRVWWGIKQDNTVPSYKRFLSEVSGIVTTTWWTHQDVGHNDEAKKETRLILGDSGAAFDTPKPLRLLKRIIEIATHKPTSRNNDDPIFSIKENSALYSTTPQTSTPIKSDKNISQDIVLDFFSGSGTTAHAVMALNAEDGGQRKFIMVQLPEVTDAKSEAFKAGYKTIADIGKERIRRAGSKIKAENTLTAPNLDVGFRVLKVDSSNMKDVYYTPDTVQQADLLEQISNIRPDRTPEDLLFQVLLDGGVDLTLPITQEVLAGKTVFFINGNTLAACFDTGINEEFVKALSQRQPLQVVFQDTGFESDSVKINVGEIFKLFSPHTDVKTI